MTTSFIPLFVYGTLKSGFSSGHRMAGAKFEGLATTAPGYALYRVDGYPALAPTESVGSGGVAGEIYRVSEAHLAELDGFEGCPELYQRRGIALADGRGAQAYVMTSDRVRGLPIIVGGAFFEEPRLLRAFHDSRSRFQR